MFHYIFIEKKREVETALKESENIFYSFMDNLTAVTFIKDSNSKVIYSNKSFKNLFGSNLIGSTPQELYIDKELLEKMINDDRETLRKGVMVTTELVPDLNKNLLTFRTYKFKIPRINDEPLLGGIAVDITESVKFENELKFLKDAAEAANVAKSNFLANISHEIRTPMNGIIGFTNILLGTEVSGKQKDYLEVIKKSSRQLLEIINDILDYSKIESGKMKLEYKHFNLAESIRHVVEFFVASSRKDNVNIKCFIQPEINYMVNGDELRLNQVLTNLLSNAIKFTDKGTVELKAEQLNKDESKVEIKFTVIDTGIGISSDSIEKIFERFFQLESTITKHYAGTGLGLAIVQSLLKMMESSITVKSEPEKGSEFSFILKFEIVS
ncbi:MAG: ATP-binding protein [Candidatus Wallbacteria bacterium]